MSDQQISDDEGTVNTQSEMDQLQQFKRAGNKTKRTQGNKIKAVSKVAIWEVSKFLQQCRPRLQSYHQLIPRQQ